MSARVSLRAAAVIALLLAIGHSVGYPWMPAKDPDSLAVVAAMRGSHFDVMGLTRSYFDFYVGFGWLLSVYLFGHAILYWLLAAVEKAQLPTVRAVVGVFFIEAIGIVGLSEKYLFWVPLIMNAVIALLLGIAFLTWQRDDSRSLVNG
jgi:hypothetical protein